MLVKEIKVDCCCATENRGSRGFSRRNKYRFGIIVLPASTACVLMLFWFVLSLVFSCVLQTVLLPAFCFGFVDFGLQLLLKLAFSFLTLLSQSSASGSSSAKRDTFLLGEVNLL